MILSYLQSCPSLAGSSNMARVIRDRMSREARSPSDLMCTPAIPCVRESGEGGREGGREGEGEERGEGGSKGIEGGKEENLLKVYVLSGLYTVGQLNLQ